MPLKNAAAAAAQPGAGAPDLGRIGSLQEALEFIGLWRSASPSIDLAHEGQVLEASMIFLIRMCERHNRRHIAEHIQALDPKKPALRDLCAAYGYTPLPGPWRWISGRRS